MPLIRIEILEGRNNNTLRELIENITNTTAKTLQISNKENIQVVIKEQKAIHWGQGGVLLSEVFK